MFRVLKRTVSFKYPQHMFRLSNKNILYWYALLTKGLSVNVKRLSCNSCMYQTVGHCANSIANWYKIEPQHESSNIVVCAPSKGSDHPAHTRSLITAFASRLNIL